MPLNNNCSIGTSLRQVWTTVCPSWEVLIKQQEVFYQIEASTLSAIRSPNFFFFGSEHLWIGIFGLENVARGGETLFPYWFL